MRTRWERGEEAVLYSWFAMTRKDVEAMMISHDLNSTLMTIFDQLRVIFT
jgi:hypothetical protein